MTKKKVVRKGRRYERRTCEACGERKSAGKFRGDCMTCEDCEAGVLTGSEAVTLSWSFPSIKASTPEEWLMALRRHADLQEKLPPGYSKKVKVNDFERIEED